MAGMAHGHAWPFQGHLVWPWKGQRAPQIDAKRCLSAPDQQNQKVVTDSACAESQAPDSADRGGLLALAEATARLAKHSPPNQKFVNFWYARYTRAWRLRRFSAFLNCGSSLPLLGLFEIVALFCHTKGFFGMACSPPYNHKSAAQLPKCALWITHFFSKNGGELYR